MYLSLNKGEQVVQELDTKTKILNAAQELFAKQGFDGTSVKQICNKAGVNVSLISYYFGGKEQVLVELLQNSLFEIDIFKDDTLKEDPVAGIREIVSSIVEFRVNNPEIMTILHREILNYIPRNNQIESHIYPLWNRLKKYLETGRDQGIFEFQSLEVVFQLIVSVIIFPRINPDFLKPILGENDSPDIEIINYTMDFILKGLSYMS